VKIVSLRAPDSGRVFDHDAERVAMELPADWPDDASVTVTGDDLRWDRPGLEALTYRSRTRRLAQFFAGERCLVPTRRVSPDGLTLWQVVEIVAAVHLGDRPADG
jgi:hypothetical protein